MSLRQKLASDVSAAARAKLAEAENAGCNPYIGLMTKLLTNRLPMDEVNTEIRRRALTSRDK